MTEGELYKKLKTILPKAGKYFAYLTQEYGAGSFSEEQLNIYAKEVLDEAAADILGWWNQHPRYLAARQKKGDYTNRRCFYKARDDWLSELEKKLEFWFGGAKDA